jgi:putative heme-binding domain-containing protein
VRRAAAEALARCGSTDSFDALAAALGGEGDAFLEHAIVYALHRVAPASRMEDALSSTNPAMERAAIILLDQHPRRCLSRQAVFQRLASPHPGVRSAALEALVRHADWADDAARVLEDLLGKAAFSPEDENALRLLVAAFGSRPRAARALGRALASRAATPGRGVVIIDALCEERASEIPEAWVEGLRAALDRGDPALGSAIARAAALLGHGALDDPLSRIASSESEPAELRVEALRAVLPGMPRVEDPLFAFLSARLAAGEPLARMAALDALVRARLDDAQLAKVLEAVRQDPVLSPGAVLPLLERCARDSSADLIVRHIDEGMRSGWRPRGEDLERVMAALPSSARESVRRAADAVRQEAGRDLERLRELEPLLAGGDPVRGRAVFLGKKVACSTCHRIGTEGGLVGPDLTRIGAARSGRDLLESVVFPSSTRAQGYDAYAAVTSDGAVIGIIARQTSEVVVLRTAGGGEVQLRRGDLTALERQGASLMPEGLERAISEGEMRDLMAFLQGLR